MLVVILLESVYELLDITNYLAYSGSCEISWSVPLEKQAKWMIANITMLCWNQMDVHDFRVKFFYLLSRKRNLIIQILFNQVDKWILLSWVGIWNIIDTILINIESCKPLVYFACFYKNHIMNARPFCYDNLISKLIKSCLMLCKYINDSNDIIWLSYKHAQYSTKQQIQTFTNKL